MDKADILIVYILCQALFKYIAGMQADVATTSVNWGLRIIRLVGKGSLTYPGTLNY